MGGHDCRTAPGKWNKCMARKRKKISDVVIFLGMAVNAVVIVLILILYVF